MRTTVDIPDDLYHEIRVRAAHERTTIKEMILEGVTARLRAGQTPAKREARRRFPLVRSKKPGSLKLGKEGVYEYIPFP